MNDDEIRMEILLDHYKALRNQSGLKFKKLKNIPGNDYEFNYGYLVEHNLVRGSRDHLTDGTAVYTPSGGITGHGMDIVENFIRGSRKKVEESGNKIIDKTLSYVDQIAQLVIIWSNNSELFQQALEFLRSLIG